MKNDKFEAIKGGIDAYFAKCDGQNGDRIRKPYTLSGLLCELNMTRAQFEKLYAKPKYMQTFTSALSKIEAFTEEYALTGALSASAAANSLKYNFGWGEQREKSASDEQKSIKIILDGELLRLAE
ncbi:MAG: hypothetical protein IKX77_00530 [Clostridia bacterium]|nr:hypothetical protein [Clostridia bacterium]